MQDGPKMVSNFVSEIDCLFNSTWTQRHTDWRYYKIEKKGEQADMHGILVGSENRCVVAHIIKR